MTQPSNDSSRRTFLKKTGAIATTGALLGTTIPHVHAGEENTIQIALIGCGGRGTGAASNALSVQNGPIKLVAMADVFSERLQRSHTALSGRFEKQMDVPEERRYIGFDAFEKATSHLSPGDVVIMATPPAFRWVHFGHAIEKDLNVFMEKPVAVDGGASRRMFELAKKSQEKKLKVGVGLMCRHCDARRELFDKIQDGAIGDITTLRAYRMAGPTGSAAAERRPEGMSELMYQIKNFHAFLWASGGAFSDFLIHNIDECCWMKNAWPVKAEGAGGRHYRGDAVDQNFDNYSVEYTFDDGTKMFLGGRTMAGCFGQFASYAHGTEGSAIISTAAHSPAKSRIYWGQKFDKKQLAWSFAQPETSPYQLEWDHLIQAIRQDEDYNEAERGIEASLVTAMGRLAAHTGQQVSRDEALNHDPEFAPDVDKLTLEGPAPVQADEEGKYPVPMPGLVTGREY